ncbi:MAG: hypothetical protein ACKV19_19730 [Verrucomicrobiales bacterium]
MKHTAQSPRLLIPAYAAMILVVPADAALTITNGGFEAGLAGWTPADQLGSEGAFMVQSGATSPVNANAVPTPPEGLQAAMTDAMGPGSHVLYQDIFIPSNVPSTTLVFSLFINNLADLFVTDPSLDFATPSLNQQARVDIMNASADPFSTAPGDVLQNLYQSMPGDPAVSGYTSHAFDLTTLLQTNAGQTVRLRFAEVDNVFIFNMGVDDVRFESSAVPEAGASGWLLMLGTLLSFGGAMRLGHRGVRDGIGPA